MFRITCISNLFTTFLSQYAAHAVSDPDSIQYEVCKITISYFYENSYFHNFGEFFLFSERVTCLWYDSNIVDCRNAKLSLKRPLSLHLYHQDASTGADKTVPKQNRPHIPIFFFFYPIMDYLSKPLLTFAGHLICWQFFYFNVRVQNVFVILC